MTKKDLFDGLNYINENIIEEAQPTETTTEHSDNIYAKKCDVNSDTQQDHVTEQTGRIDKNRKKHKNLARAAKALTAVAAVLVVAVLGTEVMRLNNRINELETKTSNVISQGNAQNNVYAGIKSGNELGDYVVAANYEQLYDSVKKVEDSMKEARSGDWVDGPETSGAMTDYTTSSNSDKETAMDTAQDSASASGTEYSTTNVMTEGVDESDVVKTDGKYIYMVEDGQISITDISKGEPADETLFRPEFEVPSDTIEELYVSDGKMLIISNHAGDKDETICYSYDVADPTKPALIGKARQDGYYNTSRKIGNTVYVFSDTYIRTSDMEKNVALQEDNLEKWVPQVNGKVISYDCFYIDDDTYSGTVISSFDVSTPDKTIDAKCIMNDNGEVYVSGDAMYLYHSEWSASRELTKISKISFEDGVMKTGETTSVNGYLNDKFAISQQDEYLYVLPTSDGGSQSVNSLHVLDKDMKEVGVINEIARGESIYAARFVGKYVYFITYRQTDPLFVADISDPTAPKLLGELEVSGFSEYLHMWDDTHVLGIGYGDSQQSKIKLTMFDVSDPTKPVEVSQKLIDNRDNWGNEFVYNYKAILADPKKNLIGFTANDYYLFSYDNENGFNLVEQQAVTYKNSGGYRGIYKDNDFYVAGNGEIKYFKLAE
ncbi:beta-propeller domain-containing protein [Agathobacter sp.]